MFTLFQRKRKAVVLSPGASWNCWTSCELKSGYFRSNKAIFDQASFNVVAATLCCWEQGQGCEDRAFFKCFIEKLKKALLSLSEFKTTTLFKLKLKRKLLKKRHIYFYVLLSMFYFLCFTFYVLLFMVDFLCLTFYVLIFFLLFTFDFLLLTFYFWLFTFDFLCSTFCIWLFSFFF